MTPHDLSLRGWAGGAYRPVGGSQGVESPQQSGVRIARAGSESCGCRSARSLPRLICPDASCLAVAPRYRPVPEGGLGRAPRLRSPADESRAAPARVPARPLVERLRWGDRRPASAADVPRRRRARPVRRLGGDARRGDELDQRVRALEQSSPPRPRCPALDRSPSRPPDARAERHFGVTALWMATTNLGYLDRRLWDNAGSIEISPSLSTTVRQGETVWRTSVVARIGTVYRRGTADPRSPYGYEAFTRLSGEASVRTPLSGATTFGARLFAGGYLGPSHPVRQLRVAVAGADPYETFTNPFPRSRGALLVRPDFYYHAPEAANLRAFRNDLGGRWAVGVNLELTRRLSGAGRGCYARRRSRDSWIWESCTRWPCRPYRRAGGTRRCTTADSASSRGTRCRTWSGRCASR